MKSKRQIHFLRLRIITQSILRVVHDTSGLVAFPFKCYSECPSRVFALAQLTQQSQPLSGR